MGEFVTILFDSVTKGGPEAIVALLFSLLVYLLYDRTVLVKTLKTESANHHDDLLRIIEKYQEGQIDMIHAMNEIKLILVKLEAKS